MVSLLRDTLGDNSPENDRITYVWLLAATPRSWEQRLLSGIPFFYWRVSDGSTKVKSGDLSPLMDLNTPQHAVFSAAERSVLQWAAFDPLTMPVRATSRTYRTNQLDYERLHLEETLSYLRCAPTESSASAVAPTSQQLDTATARLELRKRLLGGLFDDRHAARFAIESRFEDEQVRSRNWEILRQCAEKTGLYFESINLAGTTGQYAILWFPLHQDPIPSGTSLKPIWKLLNVKDPWSDDRLKKWHGLSLTRMVDEADALVPDSAMGRRQVTLVPLGLYSLSYPRFPLLLVDFRNRLQIRRREVTQRTLDEITAGVLGFSHLTNWYYYAGLMLYDMVWSRHGIAVDQAARLDCYSQFRIQLALDEHLDPALRDEIRRRAQSLSVNPLEASVEREIALANAHFEQLQAASGEGGKLEERLNKERREELGSFGQSTTAEVFQATLHASTFGVYTHRDSANRLALSTLDRQRRITNRLEFLDSLVKNGTPPEVTYDTGAIESSVAELNTLIANEPSHRVREHATVTLERLRSLSRDANLQNDCWNALASLRGPIETAHGPQSPGAASSSRAVLSYQMADSLR